jgi:hypothetical protein
MIVIELDQEGRCATGVSARPYVTTKRDQMFELETEVKVNLMRDAP